MKESNTDTVTNSVMDSETDAVIDMLTDTLTGSITMKIDILTIALQRDQNTIQRRDILNP